MGTYRQEMDKLRLSDKKKDELKSLYAADVKEERNMRRIIKPVVAAAACAAVLLGSVVSGNLALQKKGDASQTDDHDFTLMVNAAELSKDSPVVAYSAETGRGYAICGTDTENEVAYSINTDFTCEGENIVSITYEVSQGAIQIVTGEAGSPDVTYTETEPMNAPLSCGGDNDVCHYAGSYTVDYANQHPENVWTAFCGIRQLGSRYGDLFGEDIDRELEGFQELLGDTVITCTVNFADGSSAVKEIEVVPTVLTYREGFPDAAKLTPEEFGGEAELEEYLNTEGVFFVFRQR